MFSSGVLCHFLYKKIEIYILLKKSTKNHSLSSFTFYSSLSQMLAIKTCAFLWFSNLLPVTSISSSGLFHADLSCLSPSFFHVFLPLSLIFSPHLSLSLSLSCARASFSSTQLSLSNSQPLNEHHADHNN